MLLERYPKYKTLTKQLIIIERYFDFLSKDAEDSFSSGEPKLIDIINIILYIAKKITEIRLESHLEKVNIGIRKITISSIYDARILYYIVSAVANNLKEKAKNTILMTLKDYILGKIETLSGPSTEEMKALCLLAKDLKDFHIDLDIGTSFLPVGKIFPLSKEIIESLISPNLEYMEEARNTILSLVEYIGVAEQCDMFFYPFSVFLKSEFVEKSGFSRSTLFGNLLVQTILMNEMDSCKNEKIKSLLRNQILNLFAMAVNKKGDNYLKYIFSLFCKVNTAGLEGSLLIISEIGGKGISNLLSGIGKITVLELTKAYFNGEREVIEKLEYLERIHEEYKTKGITPAMSIALGEEDEKMGIKSDDDGKDEMEDSSIKKGRTPITKLTQASGGVSSFESDFDESFYSYEICVQPFVLQSNVIQKGAAGFLKEMECFNKKMLSMLTSCNLTLVENEFKKFNKCLDDFTRITKDLRKVNIIGLNVKHKILIEIIKARVTISMFDIDREEFLKSKLNNMIDAIKMVIQESKKYVFKEASSIFLEILKKTSTLEDGIPGDSSHDDRNIEKEYEDAIKKLNEQIDLLEKTRSKNETRKEEKSERDDKKEVKKSSDLKGGDNEFDSLECLTQHSSTISEGEIDIDVETPQGAANKVLSTLSSIIEYEASLRSSSSSSKSSAGTEKVSKLKEDVAVFSRFTEEFKNFNGIEPKTIDQIYDKIKEITSKSITSDATWKEMAIAICTNRSSAKKVGQKVYVYVKLGKFEGMLVERDRRKKEEYCKSK